MNEQIDYTGLSRDLASVLNKHGIDTQTGTPNFALAVFLVASLDVVYGLLSDRARWFGRPAPGERTGERSGARQPRRCCCVSSVGGGADQ